MDRSPKTKGASGRRAAPLPVLPLCGRAEELLLLRAALDRAEAGASSSVVLAGAQGMGKSRLAQVLQEEAERRGFTASAGVAYPMEAGVPYALFCDLLDPLLRAHGPEALMSLTRGAPEFQFVCPTLVLQEPGSAGPAPEVIPDLRNRLLWNFPSFLDRLRGDRPLLLVFEDLEWADPSSVELLHFLARKSLEMPLVTLVTIDPSGSPSAADVYEGVTGVTGRMGGEVLELEPLSPEAVVEIVAQGFGVDRGVVREFASALCRWTGGNPLFLTATLEDLVAAGGIREEGGCWVGWDTHGLTPPSSARDLVLDRAGRMSEMARSVVDLAAVMGMKVRFEVLARASGLDESALFSALAELSGLGILAEVTEGRDAYHTFVHPVLRDVFYGALGPVRVRRLHAEVLLTLVAIHGERAVDRAVELATHVELAGDSVQPAQAVQYLAEAGRRALRAHADREAVRYLDRAVTLLSSAGGRPPKLRDGEDGIGLLEDLARAHQRCGRFDEATARLIEARKLAGPPELVGAPELVGEGPSPERIAALDRRLGLVAFWAGRPEEALGHWDRGLAGVSASRESGLEARIRLARSACLQETGRGAEAGEEALEALRLGTEVGDIRIQVSAHMNLLLLHTWSGPTDQARRHGEAALSLAESTGSRVAQLSAHWAMAVLEGLTGHPRATRRHLDRAGELARALGSPLLRLRLAEVEIEYATRIGQWDRGADLAAESIRMARDLNQGRSLPRLLVLSALLHVARGDVVSARGELAEAWELAGGEREGEPLTMHTAILVRAGSATLALATGDHEEAIRCGEEGLRLVDQSGYTAWAIQRLLPTVAEASLHLRDLDRARAVATRLRREAERFEHPLGLAWSEICEALVTWLEGDPPAGAMGMARGADALEELGLLPDAARLRRQLAGRLAELGDREGAVRELRQVHDTLSGLGAEPELEKVRGQFREVGARPPTRSAGRGTGLLTARESEIARLVGERRSNKAIGRELGISPRTVGTHLSSIFRKLELDSRARLGDQVRAGLLERVGAPEGGRP